MTQSDVVPVRCSILRGGTSKAVFFLANDLPPDRPAIEAILLNVFGSPDIRQIDGLGGSTSQTSKAAIIGPPSRPDADVDYTFAQVSVGEPTVDWGGNCGNISAAVGPFSINQGFVRAAEPVTTVRVHNTNTSKVILEHVPVRGGRAAASGDYVVPGVPGTSARILMEFGDPAGSVTGRLLPTGNVRDQVELADGRSFEVSVVDAANPVVFLTANRWGSAGPSCRSTSRRTLRRPTSSRRSARSSLSGLASWPTGVRPPRPPRACRRSASSPRRRPTARPPASMFRRTPST